MTVKPVCLKQLRILWTSKFKRQQRNNDKTKGKTMTTQRKEILTPVFRVSYPHVFTPQINDEGKSVYSVTMVFDQDADLSEMIALAKEAKAKKWGVDAAGKFKKTFRKGTEDEFDLKKNPDYAGKTIAVARSTDRPVAVVRIDKSKSKTDPNRFISLTKPSEFYSGCYAMAKVSAYAYEFKGNRGVSFGLQNLLFIRNGEPIGGGYSNPEEDFSEVDASVFGDDDDVDNSALFDDDLGI
jgi:hypothetical protein